MDDPSRRAPPGSPGIAAPSGVQSGVQSGVEVRYVGAPHAAPQVSVQVSNVFVSPPVGPSLPMHVPMAAPTPNPTGAALARTAASPLAPAQPTTFAMMTDDAALRTREALVRSGPARVLGRIVGFGLVALMLALLLLMALGVSPVAILVAEVPLGALAVVAFVVARRAGVGAASHHLEQHVLRVAAEHRGVVRVAVLARATGRSLRECQVALDALVSSGHATVDADERGGLLYRIPDLEPGSVRALAEENR